VSNEWAAGCSDTGTDGRSEVSAEPVDVFLGRHETGVLASARGDEPYAVPVSYGYDGGRRFYLRPMSTPDSERCRFPLSRPSPPSGRPTAV